MSSFGLPQPIQINTAKIRYEENLPTSYALVSTNSRFGRTVLKDPHHVKNDEKTKYNFDEKTHDYHKTYPYPIKYGMTNGFNAVKVPADFRPVQAAYPTSSIPSPLHKIRAVTYPEEGIDYSLSDFAATEPPNNIFRRPVTTTEFIVDDGKTEPQFPKNLIVNSDPRMMQRKLEGLKKFK
jgi:hypothetical protein